MTGTQVVADWQSERPPRKRRRRHQVSSAWVPWRGWGSTLSCLGCWSGCAHACPCPSQTCCLHVTRKHLQHITCTPKELMVHPPHDKCVRVSMYTCWPQCLNHASIIKSGTTTARLDSWLRGVMSSICIWRSICWLIASVWPCRSPTERVLLPEAHHTSMHFCGHGAAPCGKLD